MALGLRIAVPRSDPDASAGQQSSLQGVFAIARSLRPLAPLTRTAKQEVLGLGLTRQRNQGKIRETWPLGQGTAEGSAWLPSRQRRRLLRPHHRGVKDPNPQLQAH